jgi:rod shape-determining protein MreD
MRKTSLLILGLVIFFLQVSVLPFFFGGEWLPDLWLTALLIAGLVFDRKYVIAWTLAGGFAQDLLTTNYFGLHMFPYMILAALSYGWARKRFNRHWYVSVAAVMAGSLLFMMMVGLVAFPSGESMDIPSYFLYKCIPFVMMNGTAALLLHPLLWGMKYEGESRW